MEALNQQIRGEQEIERRRKAAREEREKVINSQQTLEKLGQQLAKKCISVWVVIARMCLHRSRAYVIRTPKTYAPLSNSLASQQGSQEGGYAFEKWFYDLVNYFEITARPPYKADGRQIDGSLTLDGTTFLIETKFTKDQFGAPDIDIFMSKIVKKSTLRCFF
jgi:hypothetical protein